MIAASVQTSQGAQSGESDPRSALADLEAQLDEHVFEAIDFDALYRLEQILWGLLDRRGIRDIDGELAQRLLVDAVTRVARDPESYFGVSPPPGITKEEEKAAAYDPACPFCQCEAEYVAYAADPANIAADEAFNAELRELYAENARAWRKEHAEQIAQYKHACTRQPRANGRSKAEAKRGTP